MKLPRTINHYKSIDRHGTKGLVAEEVEAGSDTAKFLERMEQKRLSTLCVRRIDMRGKVRDKCKRYEFGGLVHYVDERSKEIIEEEAKKYEGRFTIGVYEKVTLSDHTIKAQQKRERVRKLVEEKEKQQQVQMSQQVSDEYIADIMEEDVEPMATTGTNPVQLIWFGYASQRREARLNYVTTAKLDSKLLNSEVVKTSNVSLSGLKIYSDHQLIVKRGEVVTLQFFELEKAAEMHFGPLEYKVLGLQKHAGKFYYRMLRLDEKQKPEFTHFLDEFITANKYRYKIDLEDSLNTLHSLVYERLYTQIISSFPIFFCVNANGVKVEFASYTRHDDDPVYNWLSGSVVSATSHLIDAAEVLDASSRTYRYFDAFACRHEGRALAFVANEQALQNADTRKIYEHYADKSNCRIKFLLFLSKIHNQGPDHWREMFKELADMDTAAAQSLQDRFSDISHVGFLLPVHTSLPQDELISLSQANLAHLEKIHCAGASTKLWELGFRDRRQQIRYLHKTAVTIYSGDRKFDAETRDLSEDGLRLSFDDTPHSPFDLKLNEYVELSFPSLQQKLKEPEELEKQSYKVANINGATNELGLSRDFRVAKHSAGAFFAKLIARNRDKLHRCMEDIHSSLTAQHLESMAGKHVVCLPLFIYREGNQYKINKVGVGPHNLGLLNLFEVQKQVYHLGCLAQEKILDPLIKPATNKIGKVTEINESRVLLVRSEAEPVKLDAYAFDSLTREQQQTGLERVRSEAGFHLFSLRLLPIRVYDISEFATEYAMIRSNSQVKAEQFEKDLKDTLAIIELHDITHFAKQPGALVL